MGVFGPLVDIIQEFFVTIRLGIKNRKDFFYFLRKDKISFSWRHVFEISVCLECKTAVCCLESKSNMEDSGRAIKKSVCLDCDRQN